MILYDAEAKRVEIDGLTIVHNRTDGAGFVDVPSFASIGGVSITNNKVYAGSLAKPGRLHRALIRLNILPNTLAIIVPEVER